MYLIVFNATGKELNIDDIEEGLKRELNIIRINGKCDNRGGSERRESAFILRN